MNIAANLELLKANKDAIRNAITRKGILTGGNDELSSYPDKIMRIGRGVVPDIPDLSVLENHEDIIYFSVMPKTYWGMTITLDTGTYTVKSGTIVNGSFVSSDISAACASNTNYFCINDTDSYAIYQLTCTSHITAFVPKVDATKGTIGIAEVYGAVTSSFRNFNFTGITSLRTCTIKGTLELVTSMSNCFYNCSSLTTLDTSSWVLSAVTSMYQCFNGCSSLTSLDTSSWVLSAVTNMSNCFSGCSSLTTLDTSSWVLSAVTNMYQCFSGCSSLTTLDTSSWVLSAVTNMSGCFSGCSSLTTLDTSSWVLSAVTSMYQLFLRLLLPYYTGHEQLGAECCD
jgi:surface protein